MPRPPARASELPIVGLGNAQGEIISHTRVLSARKRQIESANQCAASDFGALD